MTQWKSSLFSPIQATKLTNMVKTEGRLNPGRLQRRGDFFFFKLKIFSFHRTNHGRNKPLAVGKLEELVGEPALSII